MIRHGCVNVAQIFRIAATRTSPRPDLSRYASAATMAKKKTAQDKGEAMMSATIQDRFASIQSALTDVDNHGDWKVWEDEIVTLEKKVQHEAVWEDVPLALKISARLGDLRRKLSTYQELKRSTVVLQELADLAQESSDVQLQRELIPELASLDTNISDYINVLWLSQPTDPNSAYMDIRAGSGGTEACDWASMLVRMYTKWAHSRGYTVDTVNESEGDVAGIKSATLLVSGPFAYGYAQYETGVHRLVRVSPFDSAGARHTSFASVRVSPHFDETSEEVGIELNPKDLQITTMRSQGAGETIFHEVLSPYSEESQVASM
ncbi:hypothetical protein EIP91_012253 [Steccherinum ochraceum]|uniref:Peptide chain release factor domain-containing protein n=1 Tax=Steccherinum ochraceum TaxID=92696 RepID=A0A4R0RJA5_9APHY|nr:hypothetical protein EIP91_012253 [Steccherinum ochraceum]